jgi:hypothetical protein
MDVRKYVTEKSCMYFAQMVMSSYVLVARAASGLYVQKENEIEYLGMSSCEGMPVQKMDMSLYVPV